MDKIAKEELINKLKDIIRTEGKNSIENIDYIIPESVIKKVIFGLIKLCETPVSSFDFIEIISVFDAFYYGFANEDTNVLNSHSSNIESETNVEKKDDNKVTPFYKQQIEMVETTYFDNLKKLEKIKKEGGSETMKRLHLRGEEIPYSEVEREMELFLCKEIEKRRNWFCKIIKKDKAGVDAIKRSYNPALCLDSFDSIGLQYKLDILNNEITRCISHYDEAKQKKLITEFDKMNEKFMERMLKFSEEMREFIQPVKKEAVYEKATTILEKKIGETNTRNFLGRSKIKMSEI